MGRLPSGEVITDEEFARRPQDWPSWPILPVKRTKNGKQELGIIVELPSQNLPFAVSGGAGRTGGYIIPSMVFLGSMFDDIELTHRERKSYPSLVTLFADGWVVD